MPSRGKYIALFIIDFCMGVLWGLLSIGAFATLNRAISAGDVEQAQKSAKKMRIVFFIGLGVTIAIIIACVIIGVVAAKK